VLKPKIGFAGLTHLAICSAAAAAANGFDVVAAAAGEDRMHCATLAAGKAPFSEPGLDALLIAQQARLVFADSLTALGDRDIVFIAMDVPTDDRGQSDLAPINAIVLALQGIMAPHALLVVLSQVPPGFTRQIRRPQETVFYQVETLVFGRAVERATTPERFIVGCADPRVSLPQAYADFLASFKCPILPMRYESAELAKISINLCLVASVTVANTLAELCGPIGADWSEIAPALKLDRRIGPHAYLTPGLGISGGNLERDINTVRELAGRHCTHHDLFDAALANSRHAKDWPWRQLKAEVLDRVERPRIAIWGIAYKENTSSTKNSPAIRLLDLLMADGRCDEIRIYDPAVPAEVSRAYGRVCTHPLEAVEMADALCLLTPWEEFRCVDVAALAARLRGRVIIDPYGLLDQAAVSGEGIRHVTIGVETGRQNASASQRG
jgi:UDPglucose 6-dehydrogenase